MGKNKFLKDDVYHNTGEESWLKRHTSTPVQRFFGGHKLVPAPGPKQNS